MINTRMSSERMGAAGTAFIARKGNHRAGLGLRGHILSRIHLHS